jgi:zinc/manganese transport system substrate-binding protein
MPSMRAPHPAAFLLAAIGAANGIPVVGVYETMPQPGFDYQPWMPAEATALKNAISDRTSTEHL